MTKQYLSQKLSSWRLLGDIELIPPNAEEFSDNVYGSAKARAACKRWALRGHYALVRGVMPCAHGLLGLRYCPAKCTRIRDFDHANVWVDIDGGSHGRPEAFILMAPYLKEVSAELRSYADHHGLRINQNLVVDGWYGYGTIPIRLTLQEVNYLGPLEEMIVALSYCAPIKWPDDDEIDALAPRLDDPDDGDAPDDEALA